jgi:hypothetical protein
MIEKTELLQRALLGFQVQRERIDTQMEEVRRRLNGAVAPPADEEQPKCRLSAKGRAAIIAATKRRWAKARREKRNKGR